MKTEADSKVTEIVGRGIVVRGNDIDTDRIIPARYLRTVTFQDLGAHAFEDERVNDEHPFNKDCYQGAKVLVVNKNFGCGSSREHAPQALMRWGLQGFIGESFAEIFFGNCVALGLPCLVVSEVDIGKLMDLIEREPAQELQIDVTAQRLRFASESFNAKIPDAAREQLTSGTWDALGQLLEAKNEIKNKADKLPYIVGF